MRRKGLQDVAVQDIDDGPGLRGVTDQVSLDELTRSVRERGLVQPLRVYPSADGRKWVCGIGSRRLQAARLAGLETVPCVLLEAVPGEADLVAEQLTENLLRADLQPMEQARAFRRLIDLLGFSQRDLAEYLAVSPATVNRTLALLDLHGEVQDLVQTQQLAPSTALTLVNEPAVVQIEEGRRMAESRTTRAEAERRRKPAPRVFTLATPRKWKVVVTATKKRASDAELLEELAGLVANLRGEGEPAGPRLAA